MKILVLTSLYPVSGFKTNTTPVVHYFAKEWVKLGMDVHVIHNENKYLLPLYFIPKFLKDKIESSFGVRIPGLSQRQKINYDLDGVKVSRIPILKILPFGKFSDNKIRKHSIKIISILTASNFFPDVIIGHWEYPQIPLIYFLGKEFANSKKVIVFHGINYVKKWPLIYDYLMHFDYIGFRSMGLKREFEHLYGLHNNSFLCYSGIPEEYVNNNRGKTKHSISKFLFVGLLIQRKFPEIIFNALIECSFRGSFFLQYIGQGPLRKTIQKDVDDKGYNKSVSFLDKVPRKKVLDYMSNSDCLIMISRDEAFGLVYLEAMLCGCIIIASINEGMDGIIVDGYNGFLIEAGNELALINLLNRLYDMTEFELEAISKNAIETATDLTDANVAKKYLSLIGVN